MLDRAVVGLTETFFKSVASANTNMQRSSEVQLRFSVWHLAFEKSQEKCVSIPLTSVAVAQMTCLAISATQFN